MTATAKALVATKRLPSVRRRRCFPTSEIAIATLPARRMETMATNLRTNAAGSFRNSSDTSPPQLEFVMVSLKFSKYDGINYLLRRDQIFQLLAGAVATDPKKKREIKNRDGYIRK
ncbi:hypothetical protein VNO78_19745 [Psophocarpus tetragonolobus]|uniref:Uncharacterized protein n=1 Tax=Psophocarpus tetragonolobus TaxID=3891 RepID=A0AAN9S8M6_PSOTE